MRTLVTRLALFASSFAVVFALAGIRVSSQDLRLAYWAWTAACAAIVPAALLVWYAARSADFSGTLTTFDSRGESMGGYLVGYVLPIILVELRDTSSVIAVAVFVLLLSLTYAAADLHYLNPLLPLLGFRVWSVVVTAPDREHRFVAVGWRLTLEVNSRVCVTGDGPVRFIQLAGEGRVCG
jgi:hypothetical protein